MVNAAVVFILYLVSSGNLPDFTAVAAFPSQAACQSAAEALKQAISTGQDQKLPVCFSMESLSELAQKNGVSGK